MRRLLALTPWLFVLGLIYLLIGDPLGLMGGDAESENETPSGEHRRYDGLYEPDRDLVDFFPASVMYWEPAIHYWAQEHDLNPNLIATVIQIESCGHPSVASPANAQGLFQVIPNHFDPGENQLDPLINAAMGLFILKECLTFTTDLNLDGIAESPPDVGLALVCYNGGPSPIYRPRSQWVQESTDYYNWGTGIWNDASQGRRSSATLNEWLAAGGHLCDRAVEEQRRLNPLPELTNPHS